MKVELHLLQNFPPHNLNRDETGTPKDCEFGGERRARISSQCFKRAIRTSPVFAKTLDEQIGIRTKRVFLRIEEYLQAQGLKQTVAVAIAQASMIQLLQDKNLSKQPTKKKVDELFSTDGKTKVLIYASEEELKDLASKLAEHAREKELEEEADKAGNLLMELRGGEKSEEAEEEQTMAEKKKQAKDLLRKLAPKLKGPLKKYLDENKDRTQTMDIALFGRFLAQEPNLKINAACQVAHALSTNRVAMEFDFFTAVDDLNPDAETGAGMIGSTGFNSSCFYRYMLVDVDHLAKNLGPEEEATDASRQRAFDGTRAFLSAAMAALPTGKQNSFAAQARPALALAVARPERSMPMSLVNAFEAPAAPLDGHSLMSHSAHKLFAHWNDLQTMYGGEGSRAFLAMLDDLNGNGISETVAESSIEKCDNVHQIIDSVLGVVEEGVSS